MAYVSLAIQEFVWINFILRLVWQPRQFLAQETKRENEHGHRREEQDVQLSTGSRMINFSQGINLE